MPPPAVLAGSFYWSSSDKMSLQFSRTFSVFYPISSVLWSKQFHSFYRSSSVPVSFQSLLTLLLLLFTDLLRLVSLSQCFMFVIIIVTMFHLVSISVYDRCIYQPLHTSRTQHKVNS